VSERTREGGTEVERFTQNSPHRVDGIALKRTHKQTKREAKHIKIFLDDNRNTVPKQR